MLVHIFDKTEHQAHGWMPCYQGWCAAQYADRLSATVVNPGQTGLWGGSGGFVLSPFLTTVNCAYGGDGGSMKQPGGCNPTVCLDRWHPWNCAFEPTNLKEMMEYQRTRGGYNEMCATHAHHA